MGDEVLGVPFTDESVMGLGQREEVSKHIHSISNENSRVRPVVA